MGPTGVGKSTVCIYFCKRSHDNFDLQIFQFINSLLDKDQPQMVVGHTLKSCTSTIDAVEVKFPPGKTHLQADAQNKRRRLITVDTPGFDNASVDDSEILRRIAVWLALS